MAPNSWTLDTYDRIPEEMRGKTIQLLRSDELEGVEPGTTLVSIIGEIAVVGQDTIDTDTRGGYLAYGMPVGWTPAETGEQS